MSSKKTQQTSNQIGPKLPGGPVKGESKSIKLDESSIDALIKGLAGVGSGKVKKDDTSDDAIQSLGDSIKKHLDVLDNDLTVAITGTLIEKLNASKEIELKEDERAEDDTKQYQSSLVTELMGTDPKSGLGLTNLILSSIAQGVYYINDALFGYKKWKPDNTSVKTNTITKYDNDHSLLGVLTAKDDSESKTNKLAGNKAKDKGILGTEIDAFLSIVDALDAGLKKGKLKDVAKNFKPEEVVGILSSLQEFSTQMAAFELPATSTKTGNPLGTLGQIFDSLNTFADMDYDKIMDSMDDLSEFLVSEDFAEKIQKINEELEKINADLTLEFQPETVNKNVSNFTNSLNQLFDLFKDLKMKDFFSMKLKSALLTSDSSMSLSNMINPIVAEAVKIHEEIMKHQKEVSEVGDDVGCLKKHVFDPLAKVTGEVKLKDFIQFRIVASSFTSFVCEPLQNLMESLKDVKVNHHSVTQSVKSFRSLEILGSAVSRAASKSDIKSAKQIWMYSKIGSHAFKSAGKMFEKIKDAFGELNANEFNDIDSQSIKMLQLTDFAKYTTEMCGEGKSLILTAPLTSFGFGFVNKLMPKVGSILTTLGEDQFNDLDSSNEKVQNLKTFSKELAKMCAFGSTLIVTAPLAKIGFAMAFKSMKKINRLLNVLVSSKFPDTGDANSKISELSTFVKRLATLCAFGMTLMITAPLALISFKLTIKTIHKLGTIVGLSLGKYFKKIDGAIEKLELIETFTKGLAKILVAGASMLITAIPALIGFSIARMGLMTMKGLITMIKKFKKEDLKLSKENMESLGIIIGVIGGAMVVGALVGALVMAKMKELLAFSAIFAAFTMGVLGSINLASKGMSRSLKAGKEIAILITTLAALMMFAAATGGWVMKHIGNILMFGIALGAFIMLVVGALNLATRSGGGLRHLEKSAKAIIGIIVVSAAVMLLGGVIFMTQKKMILYSLVFALILGAFCFALCKSISNGAKAINRHKMGLVLIMAFEIVTAAVLLLPSYILAKNPKMMTTLGVWTLTMWLYTKGISKLCKQLAETGKNILLGAGALALIGFFNMEMAATMYILVKAAEELALSPDYTTWYGLLLLATAGAMLYAEEKLLEHMTKSKSFNARKLAQGAAILSALGGISAEMAGVMYLWVLVAEETEGHGESLVEVIVLGNAMIVALALVLKTLSKIPKKDAIVGAIILEGLVGISITMAYMMRLWNNIGQELNGHKEDLGYAVLIAAGLITGVLAVTLGLGELAVGTVGIGAGVIAAGAAILEGLILISMNMAVMMRMWVGVAADVKELEDFNYDAVSELFKTIGTIAVQLVETFSKVNMFDLLTCCGAASMLGNVISDIAEGVADAANMHYTKYENGKKVGEFNLTKDDFKKAAENTKQVVSILGGAILEIYDQNPEIFEGGNDLAGLLGLNTKFSKVCGSVMTLGQVISLISAGVASAANMNFTKYENGKEIGKFNLMKEDFKKAAENTKEVVKVLGQAIIDIYNENPEMFQFKSTSWNPLDICGFSAIADAFGAETPFAKTCRTVGMLGGLISEIADSVIKMANGDVKYWVNGKEMHRNITPLDYANAIVQTNLIITCLGNAVIKAYNDHPDLFSSSWGALGDGLGFNPKFKKIIDTISSLGTLIKNIADGIQTFANGAVPVYGNNGEVVSKRPIGQSDYQAAADSVVTIVSTLGNAVMDVYEHHKEWFEDSSWWSYVAGDDPSNTPFAKTVACLTNLANLVGSFAQQVETFAKSQIPIYGPDGKEIGRIQMTNDTYKKAGECIGTVISTLVTSLNDTYTKNKDFFDEDNWEPLEKSLTSLSQLIGKYASNIKDWAAMEINLYDDNGKQLGKKVLTDQDIVKTGETIEKIIVTAVTAVQRAYNGDKGKNKALFEAINSDSKTTWFSVIVESTEKSSQLISKLAQGVKDYANMRVDKYDDSGKKVGTRAFSDEDFVNAGKHISMILTSITGAVQKTYNAEGNAQMFKNASNWGITKDNTNPFSVVAQAGQKAGEMISLCAKGFKDVANIPALSDEAKVKEVQQKTKRLLMALCQAVQETYFELDGNSIVKKSIFDDATDQNSIINRIATTIAAIAKMTANVVNTYENLAKTNTSAIEKVCGTSSETNLIYKMIKGLAEPIIDILNPQNTSSGGMSVYQLFSGDEKTSYFGKVKNGVDGVSKMMSNIQSTYDSIAKTQIDISGAGEKIKQMINGLANPIIDIAANDTSGVFGNAGGGWALAGQALNGIIDCALCFINPVAFIGKKVVEGFFDSNKEPDTPFGRVVFGLAQELQVMSSIFQIYASLQKTNVKGLVDSNGEIPIIRQMIEGLTKPIIAIANDESNQEKFKAGIEYFHDLSEDICEIFLDEDKGLMNIYTELSKLKMVKNPGELLRTMMDGVCHSFDGITNADVLEDTVGKLEDVFAHFDDIFEDAEKGLFSIYENLKTRMIDNVGMTTGKGSTQLLQTLMRGLNSCFTEKNTGNLLNLNLLTLTHRFNTIESVFEDIFEIYEQMPQMNKDISYFIPWLTKLQTSVGNVPKMGDFEKEVKTLTKFNDTTNSLRIQNVKALQDLMIELNKFGSKFGNLDKFTEVLATKLSNCLTYLADQIRDSAKIVDKTGELNEARKKQIQETIKQFDELSRQGINVFIQQGGSDGSSATFSSISNDSSASQSSSSSGSGGDHTPNPPNSSGRGDASATQGKTNGELSNT
jgi:hypothetical protein